MECAYHIALNLRVSKLLQIMILKDFVEIISRIHCLNHTHCAHVMYSLVPSSTYGHTTSAQSHSYQQSNAYFGASLVDSAA